MSRYQISKLLYDELVDLVEAFFPMDRNQASPTAAVVHGSGLFGCSVGENVDPQYVDHWCRLASEWEASPPTKLEWDRMNEQDRIAKALEPVVAEHLLQKLPKVLEDMIRWWATEPSPPATLISTLKFRQSRPHEFHNDGLDSTVVECGDAAHFIRNKYYPRCQYRRYLHSDFDDRLHPHHFGIVVVLKRLRNIDPLARYGETVIREVPDGWEVSADLGYHPTARLIKNALWDQVAFPDPETTTLPHLKKKHRELFEQYWHDRYGASR